MYSEVTPYNWHMHGHLAEDGNIREYVPTAVGSVHSSCDASPDALYTGGRAPSLWLPGPIKLADNVDEVVQHQGRIQGGPRGPGPPPLTTKNEAPAPKLRPQNGSFRPVTIWGPPP